MFYVPKAIKAIFLSALIGTISVQNHISFLGDFNWNALCLFFFIFTLQLVAKEGVESTYKWAGERDPRTKWVGGHWWKGIFRGSLAPCGHLHSKSDCSRLSMVLALEWPQRRATSSSTAKGALLVPGLKCQETKSDFDGDIFIPCCIPRA